jgi:hypothetical protein
MNATRPRALSGNTTLAILLLLGVSRTIFAQGARSRAPSRIKARSHLIMNPRSKLRVPSGAKARSFCGLGGTAKAVPCPKPIYEMASSYMMGGVLEPRGSDRSSPQRRTGTALVATHTHFPSLLIQVSTKRSRRTYRFPASTPFA